MILIAGPCALESKAHAIDCAGFISETLEDLGAPEPIDWYFKTSFDKANRTSGDSPRGCGIGILIETFDYLRNTMHVKTLTDVHNAQQPKILRDYCDVLQIPAMLSRQTDIIAAAADTNLIVNIKKSQGMHPLDMTFAAEKASNASEVWLTERGHTHGYRDLIVDIRSPLIMKYDNPTAKVIFDATHSCQSPSGWGVTSSGHREFALPYAKAMRAVGVDGFFIETHPEPIKAPSDGDVMIPHKNLAGFLEQILEIKDGR